MKIIVMREVPEEVYQELLTIEDEHIKLKEALVTLTKNLREALEYIELMIYKA